MQLEGSIAEQPQSRFSSTLALPTLCEALIKAAYDPRIVGVVVKIDPLAAGWGKLQVRESFLPLCPSPCTYLALLW